MSPPNTCWPLDQKVFYWGALPVHGDSFVIFSWGDPKLKQDCQSRKDIIRANRQNIIYTCIWCRCSCNCPVDFLEESSQMVALRTHALHQWCLIMHHGCPSHVLSSIFMYILYMVYTVYTVYTVYLIHNPTLAVLQGLPAFAIFMDQT